MWIGRRWQSASEWFGRRSGLSKLFLAGALFTSPCWCGCGGMLIYVRAINPHKYTDEDREFFHNQTEYQEGTPSVARRLKAEMESIQDPDEALRQHPDWALVRFPNGQWLFGHGVNSHGLRVGRGTLVVKDSRGQVRIFFGHVCGTNQFLDNPDFWQFQSLNNFYARVADGRVLREWFPDQ